MLATQSELFENSMYTSYTRTPEGLIFTPSWNKAAGLELWIPDDGTKSFSIQVEGQPYRFSHVIKDEGPKHYNGTLSALYLKMYLAGFSLVRLGLTQLDFYKEDNTEFIVHSYSFSDRQADFFLGTRTVAVAKGIELSTLVHKSRPKLLLARYREQLRTLENYLKCPHRPKTCYTPTQQKRLEGSLRKLLSIVKNIEALKKFEADLTLLISYVKTSSSYDECTQRIRQLVLKLRILEN